MLKWRRAVEYISKRIRAIEVQYVGRRDFSVFFWHLNHVTFVYFRRIFSITYYHTGIYCSYSCQKVCTRLTLIWWYYNTVFLLWANCSFPLSRSTCTQHRDQQNANFAYKPLDEIAHMNIGIHFYHASMSGSLAYAYSIGCCFAWAGLLQKERHAGINHGCIRSNYINSVTMRKEMLPPWTYYALSACMSAKK